MNKSFTTAQNAFLIAAMFAIALWAIHRLPAGAQVAIHWGPDGQPDTWVGQWASLLILPIVACVLWFLLSVYPQGFSIPGKPMPSADDRRTVFSRVLLVQLALQASMAINALDHEVDTSNYISVALGMIYILIGAGKTSAGRWIFGSGGLGIIIVSFGLQQGDKVLAVFVLALAAPLLTALYSYLISRPRS
jgi:hypothetical protein